MVINYVVSDYISIIWLKHIVFSFVIHYIQELIILILNLLMLSFSFFIEISSFYSYDACLTFPGYNI